MQSLWKELGRNVNKRAKHSINNTLWWSHYWHWYGTNWMHLHWLGFTTMWWNASAKSNLLSNVPGPWCWILGTTSSIMDMYVREYCSEEIKSAHYLSWLVTWMRMSSRLYLKLKSLMSCVILHIIQQMNGNSCRHAVMTPICLWKLWFCCMHLNHTIPITFLGALIYLFIFGIFCVCSIWLIGPLYWPNKKIIWFWLPWF